MRAENLEPAANQKADEEQVDVVADPNPVEEAKHAREDLHRGHCRALFGRGRRPLTARGARAFSFRSADPLCTAT